MNWHTKWFRNLDEVEYIFGRTLFGEQNEMIMMYLTHGIVPDNGGCWTCMPAEMRRLCAQIRDYEIALDKGEATWPWTGFQNTPLPSSA